MEMLNLFRFFSFLFFIYIFSPSVGQKYAAIEGELDLSDWNMEILNLDGEWDFYVSQFIDPEIAFADSINPDMFIRIPSYWSDFSLNGQPINDRGFASYGLKIRLPDNFSERLAFQLPVFDDSYVFYVNGEKKAENGKVGETENLSIPGYKPMIIVIQPDSNYLELLIHVSNFHHRRGGFWKSAKMGVMDDVINQSNKYNSLIYVSLGILFTFFLLFLFFFIFDMAYPV